MFLGVVACLLFFNVQSSQGLTVRIKPNRKSIVFESGIKPNVTCESDCGYYNWKCNYEWRAEKNGRTSIYIDKNNSRIDTPLKENVTLLCYVTHEYHNDIKFYSNRIKIFIKERLLSTATPIYDSKNDNDERTNITRESEYAPRNITIRSNGDMDDLQEGSGYIEISCNADCNPECDIYNIYHNGALVYASKHMTITKDRKNSGRYQCAVTNSISDNFVNSTNSVDINIKYAPSNVRIQYWSDSEELQEGPGYIEISCNADCNPECARYQIYHNGAILKTSKQANIQKDRENSGRYKCAALNSLGQSVSNTTNITIHYTTVILESNKKKLAININEILPRDVSCSIDCNFPGCDSKIITVKRNSQRYTSIWSRDSIFENRAAKLSDDGTFVCMVGNKMSENNFTLIIHHGPRNASVLGKNHLVSGAITEKEDTSMTIPLNCSSSCNPPCKIAWYKDKRSLLRDNPVIDIRRDRSMSGLYHCQASGVEGIVESNPVHLTIQYPPGDVTITPGDDTFYTKLRGKPLHDITCEADCVPECTYRWYREGYRYWYTAGNSLFATESYYDTGSSRFQCYASNDIEPYNNYSRWITVKVKYGPDNVTIIPSLPAIENSSFTLTCSASCYHGCQSYSWYHDGRSINQRTKLLQFHRLSKEDSGRYRCQVTDYFGEKSGYYTVNVQYDPKYVTIQYRSSHKHLIEGQDRLTITCDADCQPRCIYQFYQNEKLLNKRYIYEPVHRNMSGRYSCAAKNSFMNAYRNSSNIQNIKIKYKPMITSTKNQTTITAPSLLDLTFSVDGSPSSNVTIFHETKTLTFLPHVTGQLSFNVSIESCLDRGEYSIEAVNDVGFGSFNFMPNIKCSPIVVRHSNVAHKEFRVGDLLHLTVTFMANPTAEVQWSFVPWNQNTSLEVQAQQIQTHKESTKLVLILSDTNKFGKYILELKNELGKISKEFNIQGPIVVATKTDPGTTISSRDSDSDGDRSMSPTSWKGKTNALRETEMNTFLLQQDKLHEEVQKLRLEGDVLRLKRNYYVIKLQVLMKEHPDIIDEVFGED